MKSQKLKVKELNKKHSFEFRELTTIFQSEFGINETYNLKKSKIKNLLKKNDLHVIMIKKQKEIIGGLTIYVLESYFHKNPIAYLYDIAIKREFQQQGLGSLLLTYTKEFCAKKGYSELFIQADKKDSKAIEFYRKNLPDNESEVIHFTYLPKS